MTEIQEEPSSPEIAAIDRVRDQVEALNRMSLGLVTLHCAAHFKVKREDIIGRQISTASDYGMACAAARNCAMYLMHVGASWTVTRCADVFGLRRTAGSTAISKIEDLRDADPATDQWLSAVEAALSGKG